MIEDAKEGKFDIIAVWKIDRLSRNLSHLLTSFEELKKYNVSFYSVKENIDFSGPIGKLTFQIFGALAEFEREMIQTRTYEGKLASARMGNYVSSSCPFGYEKIKSGYGKGNILKIIPEEKEVILKIYDMFVSEGMNYSAIASKLTKLNICKGKNAYMLKKLKTKEWTDAAVKKILKRTEYAGFYIYKPKGKKEKVDTPQIVSIAYYEIAKKKIEQVEENKNIGRGKYLLSGKIECILTGRKFVGVSRTKGGYSYRRKKRVNKDTGEVFNTLEFPGKALDDHVWGEIEWFINRPKDLFKSYKKYTSDNNVLEECRNKIEFYQNKIYEEEGIKDRIEQNELRGRYSEEKALSLLANSDKAIKEAEKDIDILKKKIEEILSMEFSEKAIESVSKIFKKKLKDISDEQKRLIVDYLVEKVVVVTNTKGSLEINVIFRFNPDIGDSDDTGVKPNSAHGQQKNTLTSALNLLFGVNEWS